MRKKVYKFNGDKITHILWWKDKDIVILIDQNGIENVLRVSEYDTNKNGMTIEIK